MTDLTLLPDSFVDVNTGERVDCRYDDTHKVAEPDSWGMVQFHPHPPALPPNPTYTYELTGIPDDAVLGVLAKSTHPGLCGGLETIVDKLSDTRNRLEYPPGQRGNPLPVSQVIRAEYVRMFDGEESNIYRMQVYTWRLLDVVRVCKRLLLDPDKIFRTQTSPEPSGLLNFAGDSYYGDDIRLREPNCEPLLSDALIIEEGKYRVFRKAPGHHPRDRPATYHDNYSEVAGKPDPLHDFGIKHWRNDAGQAALFRYACCWQPMGSPGCLISYPSKDASQTVRNNQGGLDRVGGVPVFYTWFGGFAPSKKTAQYRGTAFVDRGYADALHAKIVASLSSDALIDKIATRKALDASETRVIAQVAEWMHQYNEPLLGCALYSRETVDVSNVEAYLDRVVKDRGVTKIVPKQAQTTTFAVPQEILDLIETARRYGLTSIENDLDTIRRAFQLGRKVKQSQVDAQRALVAESVPLQQLLPFGKTVDTRDQWILEAKRKSLDERTFQRLLLMLRYNPVASERADLIAAFESNDYVRLGRLMDDYSLDRAFKETLATDAWKTLKPDDPYLQMLLRYAKKISDAPFFKQEDLDVVARLAFKKFVRRPQETEESEKILRNHIQITALTQSFPRAVEDMQRTLRSSGGDTFPVDDFNVRREFLLKFAPETVLPYFPREFLKIWTFDVKKIDDTGAYFIPDRVIFLTRLREFLVDFMNGVKAHTETWREAMRKQWGDLQTVRAEFIEIRRRENEIDQFVRLRSEYKKNLLKYYDIWHNATAVADTDMDIKGQAEMFSKMWELLDRVPEELRDIWVFPFNFETQPNGSKGPIVRIKAIRFVLVQPGEKEPLSFAEAYAYSERQPNQKGFTLIYPLTNAWINAHIASLEFIQTFLEQVYARGVTDLPRVVQMSTLFLAIEEKLTREVEASKKK